MSVAARHRGAGVVLLLTASLLSGACSAGTRHDAAARPEHWAPRIQRPGLPKLHRVDANLYRSAQPTAEGLREAQRLGIRTVINLRGSDSDRELLRGTGLNYVWIPMSAFDPQDEAFGRFLRTVSDASKGPFLVHCRQGKDRTGAARALYRKALQGWKAEDAVREMRGGGYGFNEFFFQNLTGYVRGFDVRPYASAREARAPALRETPSPF